MESLKTVFDLARFEAERIVEDALASAANELSLAGLAIRSLPSNLASLTHLVRLDLNRCSALQDLQPLAALSSLQSLHLSGCSQLQDLQPLAALSSLQSLHLSGCSQLQDLQPLAALSSLQSLNLRYCGQLQDLQPLAALSSLQSLDLRYCSQLQDLQPLAALSSLQSLNLMGCSQLQDLQPLAALSSLQSLHLNQCSQLQDLQPLAALSSLQSLHLSECSQIQDLQPLAALSSLQSLDLSYCSQLQDLQPLAALSSLQSLHLSECSQIQDLQPLAALSSLQSLHLSECSQIQDLQPLAALSSLQSLHLSECSQIQDLQPLAALSSLQSLDLRYCSQLQDLQPLAALSSLQSLNLMGCSQLQDLQLLAALSSLQSLHLSECSQIQDLQPLAALSSLQSLHLSECSQLQDLQPLAALSSLQSLHLSECSQLQDLQPLAALSSLQSLDLSGCSQLQDLQPLAALSSLQSLDLSGCSQLQDLQLLAALSSLQSLHLSECSQLQDLQPLAALSSLQSLDLSYCSQLQDLQPLAALSSLQSLDLSFCSQLQDLQPLAALSSLQSLDLSFCSQLQDLQPLAALSSLRTVHVMGVLIDCSPTAQPLASWLKLSELYGDALTGAPNELGSKNRQDNSLLRIRAWQNDLLLGEAPNSTVKVLLLGNGHVGKTQISRRLRDKDFDPSVPSTHGIDLEETQIIPSDKAQTEIRAQLWDFGGQSIYLGTHGLFLDSRAIYVIAWTPHCENTGEVEQNGIVMRNRRLHYWLDYVRSLAGSSAPVIVAQTQCDRESSFRLPPVPPGDFFDRLRTTYCSASQPGGISRMRLELESAARYQLERYGKVRLPLSWSAVIDELRTMRQQKTRTIPYSTFEQLCWEKNKSAVPGVVIEYLHRSGQVFYRNGAFADKVVLDLDWALDGIYAVLDRNVTLPILKQRSGRFSATLLAALVWRDYSPADHALFLSLMEQCRICFKTAEDSYVAPDALPAEEQVESAIQSIWHKAKPDATAQLEYPFLHEGVLRAMLCGIGEKAGENAVYWKFGVCFYDTAKGSAVRIRSVLDDPNGSNARGRIIVDVTGERAAELCAHLLQSIVQVNIGNKPEIRWLVGSPKDAIEEKRAEDSKPIEAFAEVDSGPAPLLPGQPLPVYVSYAWGGESDALVDAFDKKLPDEFQLIRDKSAMRPGDWILTFMQEISRAEKVLVVLSEKYLRSVYCMRELLGLYQRSLGDRTSFLDKVIVLTMGDLQFSRATERAKAIRYWQEEDKALDAALAGLDRLNIGDADRAEQLAIKDFAHRVSDILWWVSDTLMPRASVGSDGALNAAIGLLQKRSTQHRAAAQSQ